MRTATRLMLTTVILMMPATPSLAQNTTTLPALTLPAGQSLLNISATERVQVPQDLLIASLRIEKSGPDAKKVQNDINTLMKSATDAAKAVTTVKISTGGYYVYEETPAPVPIPANGTVPAPVKAKKIWRGTQSLELKSASSDDLLKLVGELQDMGLMADGLNYTLSPEKADEVKDNLMEAALGKLKTRAERAAKAMGKTQTDLIEVNVDAADNAVGQPVMMRAMAMAAPMAKMEAPTAEPGETEITLTVSARAVLKP